MKRKMLATVSCTLILSMVMGLSALAAPQTMSDGQVFDPEFYAQTYPDVVAAFGTDANALYHHYVACGKAEGRLPYAEGTSVAVAKDPANLTPDEQLQVLATQIEQYRAVISNDINKMALETSETMRNQYNAEAQASAQQIVNLNAQYVQISGQDYVTTQTLITGRSAVTPCVIHTSAGDIVPEGYHPKYGYRRWNNFTFYVVLPSNNVKDGTAYRFTMDRITESGSITTKTYTLKATAGTAVYHFGAGYTRGSENLRLR